MAPRPKVFVLRGGRCHVCCGVTRPDGVFAAVGRAPQYGFQMCRCYVPRALRKIRRGTMQKEVITGACGVGWNRGKVRR